MRRLLRAEEFIIGTGKFEIELMEAAACEENPFEKEFFWNR